MVWRCQLLKGHNWKNQVIRDLYSKRRTSCIIYVAKGGELLPRHFSGPSYHPFALQFMI